MYNRDRLYGRRWRNARRVFLNENPLCVMCTDENKVTTATEVDHIERHQGDVKKFWDRNNWQALCAYHHRSIKAQMERSGKIIGSNEAGLPLDPRHHWHRKV